MMSRITKKLGWSWKIPVIFQLHKYTITNLQTYLHYLTQIQTIPPDRLKFADESHLVTKTLAKRKVLSLVNQRAWVKQNTLSGSHATLTILTSLNPAHPVFVDYTETVCVFKYLSSSYFSSDK